MKNYKGCNYEISVNELKNNSGFSGSVKMLYDQREKSVTQEIYPSQKALPTKNRDEAEKILETIAKKWIDDNFEPLPRFQ